MNFTEAIQRQDLSFVILGKFNAQIFNPSWMALEGLISKEEAEQSEVKINSKGVSLFKTGWFEVEVTEERCKILTSQNAYFEMLRDCAMGIFSDLASTPVRSIGINLSTHLSLRDENEVENLLLKFTPEPLRRDFFEKSEFERTVVRKTTPEGYQRISIEKSILSEVGVFIDINNHFEHVKGVELWVDNLGMKYVKAFNLVELIEANYKETIESSNNAVSEIWKLK